MALTDYTNNDIRKLAQDLITAFNNISTGSATSENQVSEISALESISEQTRRKFNNETTLEDFITIAEYVAWRTANPNLVEIDKITIVEAGVSHILVRHSASL